jgi:hypothetical protein
MGDRIHSCEIIYGALAELRYLFIFYMFSYWVFFAEHIFVLLAAQVDQLGCLAQAYPLILRKPY